MAKRVVIVGSRGRIGSAVAHRLAQRRDLVAIPLDRTSLPLDDPARLRDGLSGLDFDILINAAAMTSVDACETDPAAAYRINSEAPGELAGICLEKSARMFHISTDYVFDGLAPGMRTEEETPNPLGIYGKSKLAGEQHVLGVSSANLVLRTSWVFGSYRSSFPNMILGEARRTSTVRAIANKWSCPCYSEDFATWIEILLAHPGVTGVLHLCNSGACSWQEYGQAVLDFAADCGENLLTNRVEPMGLDEMARFSAPRPIHSALSCERFTRLTGHTPRPWREALGEYLRILLTATR